MPLEGDLLDLERACYPRVSEIIGRQTQKEMDLIPSDIFIFCDSLKNIRPSAEFIKLSSILF